MDKRPPVLSRSLSGIDAAFLYLERKEIPLNIAAVAIAASCMGATPAPMQELFWRGIPLVPLPLPLLNMICTNVSGSPTPLYSVGRRLLASYPHVPTGYELGLGVAVQSYDGKLFFGLTADAHVAPDVARLRDSIRVCFDELCKAGIKSARRRPAKRRKRARPAPVEPPAFIATPAPQESGARRRGRAAGDRIIEGRLMQGGASASAQCHLLCPIPGMLRKLWGRAPGLRGTPPSRSRNNGISMLQGASRPTGASAAVPGDRPTICRARLRALLSP